MYTDIDLPLKWRCESCWLRHKPWHLPAENAFMLEKISLVYHFFVLKISLVYQDKIYHRCYCMAITLVERNRGYLFFSVKDEILFHWVDTIGNIFTSGAFFSEKKTPKYSVYFMFLTLSGRNIKIQYSSFPLFPVEYPFHIATYYNITSSARLI